MPGRTSFHMTRGRALRRGCRLVRPDRLHDALAERVALVLVRTRTSRETRPGRRCARSRMPWLRSRTPRGARQAAAAASASRTRAAHGGRSSVVVTHDVTPLRGSLLRLALADRLADELLHRVAVLRHALAECVAVVGVPAVGHPEQLHAHLARSALQTFDAFLPLDCEPCRRVRIRRPAWPARPRRLRRSMLVSSLFLLDGNPSL